MKLQKMKIVVASDSFKGSLTNREINDLWRDLSDENVEIVPFLVADGGDGTLDAMIESKGGEFVSLRVKGPLFDVISSRYGVFGDCAVISMCEASGLTLIKEGLGNPLKTTSFGTGELIKNAVLSGKKKIYITLGGSATNDCGIGALTALGYKFIKKDGSVCKGTGEELVDIVKIDDGGATDTRGVEFILLSDVTNSLTGSSGAARVFARQKGATDEQIEFLEKGALNFGKAVMSKYGVDLNAIVGGGAAGGMGAGLSAILGAKITSGIETILSLVGFDEQIKDADYVITGEGRIDSQSKDGKVISGILKHAGKFRKPVIAIVGCVGDGYEELYGEGLTSVFSIINEPSDLCGILSRSRKLYAQTARSVYNLLKSKANL